MVTYNLGFSENHGVVVHILSFRGSNRTTKKLEGGRNVVINDYYDLQCERVKGECEAEEVEGVDCTK